jgi:hypothetical protein
MNIFLSMPFRDEPFVEELSTLAAEGYPRRDKGRLPDFCGMCYEHTLKHGKKESGGCTDVAKELMDITRKLAETKTKPFPWVACCEMGAKHVLTPGGSSWEDPIYVTFARSPLRDVNHLTDTCQRWKVKQEHALTVQEAWRKLPIFGPRLEKRIPKLIRKRIGVTLSEDVMTSLKDLAESYRLFEFDIVIFDTLRKLKEKAKHPGVVTIKFISRASKAKARIVRLIQATIGNGFAEHLPVIGVGIAEGHECGDKELLASPKVTALAEALSQRWKPKFAIRNVVPIKEVNGWNTEVSIYLDERLAPNDKWLQDIARQITVGIDCGSHSVCLRLLDELQGLGEDSIEEFKKALLEHANQVKETFGDQEGEMLYVRVIGDFVAVLDFMKLDKMNTRTRQVVRELLGFLQPYSVRTRISRERDGLDPKKLLADDLSGKTVTDLSRKHWPYALVMQERAYKSNTSRLQQDLLSLAADLAAVICKGLTFGMMPAVPVVEHVRSWEYRRHSRSKLYEKE